MKNEILKRRIFLLLMAGLLTLFCQCTKVVSFEGAGVLSGRIVTHDEFGIENYDAAGVSVKLDSTELTAITDDQGYFIIENVPAGSYDLVAAKAGYGTRKLYSLDIFSGTDTTYINKFDLYQPSSIEIKNFRIEQEGSYVHGRGTIIHKFPNLPEKDVYFGPIIVVCYGDNSDVSYKKCMRWMFFDVNQPSDTEFDISNFFRIVGGSGMRRYFVAYGISTYNVPFYDWNFDSETGQTQSLSNLLGKPSEVIEFTYQ